MAENHCNFENDLDYQDYLVSQLQDVLIIEDGVTGNASGSYTFNTLEAEENLVGNWELLRDAAEELTLEENALEKGPEWCDVLIRVYLLWMLLIRRWKTGRKNTELATNGEMIAMTNTATTVEKRQAKKSTKSFGVRKYYERMIQGKFKGNYYIQPKDNCPDCILEDSKRFAIVRFDREDDYIVVNDRRYYFNKPVAIKTSMTIPNPFALIDIEKMRKEKSYEYKESLQQNFKISNSLHPLRKGSTPKMGRHT